MKRYIRSASSYKERDLDQIVTWNGWTYGVERSPKGDRYYKSKSARFSNRPYDETEEIDYDEYIEAYNKYVRIFGRPQA